jgi:hypothetical protein
MSSRRRCPRRCRPGSRRPLTWSKSRVRPGTIVVAVTIPAARATISSLKRCVHWTGGRQLRWALQRPPGKSVRRTAPAVSPSPAEGA